MPDNLNIEISATTEKLRNQIEVAKSDLRGFAREIKASFDVGDLERGKSLVHMAETTEAGLRLMNKQLAESRRLTDALIGDTQHGFKGLHTQITEVGKSLGDLVRIGGIGGAIYEIGNQIKEGIKSVAGIKEQAEGLGVSPEFVQTYRQAFARAGVDADAADRSIGRIVKDLGQARIALYESGQLTLGNVQVIKNGVEAITPGVQVFHGANDDVKGLNTQLGNMVNVIHGLKPVFIDFKDLWKAFGVDARQFPPTAKGATDQINALLQGFDAMSKQDPQLAAGLMSNFLGKDWPAQIRGMRELSALTAEQKQAMFGATTGLNFFTPEQLAQAQQANTALISLEQTVKNVRDSLAVEFAPGLSKEFQQEAKDLLEMKASFDEVLPAIGQMWTAVGEQAQKMWTGIVAQATGAYDAVMKVWGQLPDFFAGLATSIGNTLKSIATGISNAMSTAGVGGPAAPFAVGGEVSGSGSGDSVPALLTPGEFVNRLSSVQYYGADLFRALNARAIPRGLFSGFAAGGLVDRLHAPVRGFAEGGLVSASPGGTPVHLHLDGRQFVTTATESVASALVGAARSQQMRSAGIKPSWVT